MVCYQGLVATGALSSTQLSFTLQNLAIAGEVGACALDMDPTEGRYKAPTEKEPRRTEFLLGRHLLAKTLLRLGHTDAVVTSSDTGAPLTPSGTSGSISHTASHERVTAIAIALADRRGARIGVDLELRERSFSTDVARRILTSNEQSWGSVDAETLLTVFMAKEAIYKALHPEVHRPITFQEAWLPHPRAPFAKLGTQLTGEVGTGSVHLHWIELGAHLAVVALATKD
jgi:4'-phosphopantetheinyl transferase EntD